MLRTAACIFLSISSLLLPDVAFASGNVRGIVHDPAHRPISGAEVVLHAAGSDFRQQTKTGEKGEFQFQGVPSGDYQVSVEQPGFAGLAQTLVVTSSGDPVLHLQLKLLSQSQSIDVSESAEAVDLQSITPTTLIGRDAIERTPGADLTNSLAMITDFVPGAYMTHDQLHVRGGHQVTWAIDGVPIPNTNIASNVGPQIDPKDIDYLEVQRGGYSSEWGDRSYGVFNVVPRTGFERNGEVEISTTFGTSFQTNNQISIGNHSERFAWFGSMNGNRSDYGLETPGPSVLHDRVWGLGGFGSLIFNKDAANQFRFVTSLRRDDYQIPDEVGSSARDIERERDTVATISWAHTFSPSVLLTASPFVHLNHAHYDGDPNVVPVSTTQHLDSVYSGAQIVLSAIHGPHNARAGIFGFSQHDEELISLEAAGASSGGVRQDQKSTGHLEAAFLEDEYKPTTWLTLTGGVRLTHFSGNINENAASPRAGMAVRIPHLNWSVRAFYGRYYQAPPLSTVSGPLLDYAVSQGLGVIPLRGERDQEYQVGLMMPFHGWSADLNRFSQRATNYFDHNAIGNSNVYFPLSIAGARIYGWEFTLRSPRIRRNGEVTVAYSYQHAEAEGAVTGGLTDFSPPASGYFFLDHDQRHTLHSNLNWILPGKVKAAGGLYYGSGFTDGASDLPKHLGPHITFDASLGRSFGERWSVSLVGLNVGNRRYLLDNSQTFGGMHYAEPRQIYMQLKLLIPSF